MVDQFENFFVIGKMQTTSLMSTDHPSCKMHDNAHSQTSVESDRWHGKSTSKHCLIEHGKALTGSKVDKQRQMFYCGKVHHISHDRCCSTRNTKCQTCHRIAILSKFVKLKMIPATEDSTTGPAKQEILTMNSILVMAPYVQVLKKILMSIQSQWVAEVANERTRLKRSWMTLKEGISLEK